MNHWQFRLKNLTISLTTADIQGALLALNLAGIPLKDVCPTEDPLCFTFCIAGKDQKKAIGVLESRQENWEIVHQRGIITAVPAILRRPLLLMTAALLVFLTYFLPERVLFVQVEGNCIVSSRLIAEICGQNGLHFGSDRRVVRSERIKNILLEQIPQLKWAGITTSGCVATVSVTERTASDKKPKENSVGSIRAITDGVITQLTVTNGTPACRLGQAVNRGQLLISGYSDLGIAVSGERAEGEVFGDTVRTKTVILPLDVAVRTETGLKEEKFSLIIGKKRINLYKGSGISGDSCVKMYSENYVVLPGGFVLPVGIGVQTEYFYAESPEKRSEAEAAAVLEKLSLAQLHQQMIAGTVIKAQTLVTRTEDAVILTGSYACNEMIGQYVQEELILPNG